MRYDLSFFGPACGDGNFLLALLERKLTSFEGKPYKILSFVKEN